MIHQALYRVMGCHGRDSATKPGNNRLLVIVIMQNGRTILAHMQSQVYQHPSAYPAVMSTWWNAKAKL